MHNAWMEMHERLVRAREAAGIESAAEAARRLRIDYPTYAGHENGSRGFRARAARYARFYGVRLEWLLIERGAMKEGAADPFLAAIDPLNPRQREEVLQYIEFLKSRGG